MFSNCIFCKAQLGANQAIERFPVGRKLAFDADRGRLWVVCPHCLRWNLSPLEERWEAIEDCERQFRQATKRQSTENIALARIEPGLTLIRIGRPMRPEFAAWRYGDIFLRRRRNKFIGVGAAVALGAGFIIAGPIAGVIGGGLTPLAYQIPNFYNIWRKRRPIARIQRDGGELVIKRADAATARILPPEAGEFEFGLGLRHARKQVQFHGAEAIRVAGLVLPSINTGGGKQSTVDAAVRTIEQAGGPDEIFVEAARLGLGRSFRWRDPDPRLLSSQPVEFRLALEMSAHEQSERRAFEGELAELETAWREAEEIAAIADNLLLPERVLRFFRK